MLYRFVLSFTVLAGGVVVDASAQDAGTAGLTFATPGSIGVHWQITDRAAIRVDAAYRYSKLATAVGSSTALFAPGDPNATISSPLITARNESRTHTTTVDFAALLTLHRHESMRVYVAPQLSINFAKGTSETTYQLLSLPPPVFPGERLPDFFRPRTFETSSTDPAGALLFGVSTTIGDRFGVFGEAGFEYQRSTSSQSEFAADLRRTAFGTRSRIGVMLIF
jgi:hypothetical protein